MSVSDIQQAMAQKYLAIVLLGPPGSGKGTQGHILGDMPGYRFVSMGEILRSLDTKTQPGRQIQQHLDNGELVPAELVISVWMQHMREQAEVGVQPHRDILVLDGLPRNIKQAKLLQSQVEVERVVHLVCDDESISFERIRGRGAGRQDDVKEDVIRHRFDVYRGRTAPRLDWYPSDLIVAVDAARAPIEVLGQVVSALTTRPLDSPVAT